MYYKVYGVMTKVGFHTELFQENTYGKAEARVLSINAEQYPYFAITEHLRSGAPAIGIKVGLTLDRLPVSDNSLIDYRPNPMLNPDLAEQMFTRLENARAKI